jgi:ABC-type nitrate/sulfonate/bicarbonate transport system permease component
MSTAIQDTAGRPTAPTAAKGSGWAERHRSGLLGTAGIVIVLVAWQISTSAGLVDITFSSSPWRTAKAEVTLFRSGDIWPVLGATGWELLWGLLITFVAGIPIGLVLGRSRILHDMTEPWVIIIFWFGISNTSRVLIIVWAGILPLIINVTTGVRNIDNDYNRVATVFCTPRLTFFRTVALPATLPYILAGIRLAVGRALVGAIVAELFLASKGLGFFVQNQTSNFAMDSAMAGIVILAVVALILNWTVRLIERRFTHWAGAQ